MNFRYLLAQKEVAEEKKHKVRIMFGNGLRPTIWREFVNRFCIERIGELYGSTEGNSSIGMLPTCDEIFGQFLELNAVCWRKCFFMC